MAKIITDNQHYADIASAIRTKNETETLYKPSEMAPAILAIKGGTDLNFEVVGGTTQPENPVENTIWVNTEQEITGWCFSTENPTELVEGFVWFCTGATYATTFNALKEINVIQVPIVSSKQYVAGALINVDTKVYQNGGWHNLDVFLYYKGDQNTDITGGWTIASSMGGSVTFADEAIIANMTGLSYDGQWSVHTRNKIDVTEFNTLELNSDWLVKTSTNSWVHIGLFSGVPTGDWSTTASNGVAYIGLGPNTNSAANIIDISDITGEYYIGFAARFYQSTSYYANLNITEVVLR